MFVLNVITSSYTGVSVSGLLAVGLRTHTTTTTTTTTTTITTNNNNNNLQPFTAIDYYYYYVIIIIIKLSSLIPTRTFSYSSMGRVLMLYFAFVRSEQECFCCLELCVTVTDCNKIGRLQRQ
jgi:hypothetical protein